MGTSSPFAKVSIQATSTESNQFLFAIASSTATYATTTLLSVSNTGLVTVNSVAGGTCVIGSGAGNVTCTSDQRLKTNITPLVDALSSVKQLNGVTFNWADPSKSQQQMVGVIAQDVQKVFPQLVATSSDGFLMVDYAGLVSPLIEAVKELSNKIDSLAATIAGFAESFTSKQVTTNKLCVSDSSGNQTCITKSQLDSLLLSAGQQGASSTGASVSVPASPTSTDSVATTTDTVAPVVTLIGANPATVSVGSTYVDLGATVSDAVSPNIGYHVSVDGGATTTADQLSIDTNAPGSHTILFSATDQAGNTGTATRIVNVLAAPQPSTSDATSTATATSTAAN